MGGLFALGVLIVAGVVLLARHETGTVAGMEISEFASLTALLAILIFLSGSLFGGYRGRLSRAIRDGVYWVLFGLVLVTGYTYKDKLLPVAQQLVGAIVPGTPVTVETRSAGEQAVRIRRQLDGHFVAQTEVNGATVNMIVDTGASAVVLTPEDARRFGFDTSRLTYSVPVQTANGRSFAAPIRLASVSIGPLKITNVEALISKENTLHQSLLGMSFLSRLRSYEFSGDFLTLRG